MSEPLEQVFEAARRWGLDPATLAAARALIDAAADFGRDARKWEHRAATTLAGPGERVTVDCDDCGTEHTGPIVRSATPSDPAQPLCPTGCGCRLWTEDADVSDCACDGPCCWFNWDQFVWHLLAYPQEARETFEASRDMRAHAPFPPYPAARALTGPEAQCRGYAGDPGASAPRCESYEGHPGDHFIRPFRALTGPGEREKRAPCVHGNPCREAQCVEYGRWDAMPAQPDELQRLTAALEREHKLTAAHHRALKTTRRRCFYCWTSDRAATPPTEPPLDDHPPVRPDPTR